MDYGENLFRNRLVILEEEVIWHDWLILIGAVGLFMSSISVFVPDVGGE